MMRSGSFYFALALMCTVAAAQSDTCKDLASLKVDGVEITNAVLVPDGAQIPGPVSSLAAKLPAHCRVDGMMHRRKGVGGQEFGIGFQLSLPEAAAWNGDMMMQGGGGGNGVISYPAGAQYAGRRSGLARGFAVVSTDTGHKAKSGAFDFSFQKDQQAALDFAYQANAEVAEVSQTDHRALLRQARVLLLLRWLLHRWPRRHDSFATLSNRVQRNRVGRSCHAHRAFKVSPSASGFRWPITRRLRKMNQENRKLKNCSATPIASSSWTRC